MLDSLKNSKKGTSALIAVVILISFVGALLAVIASAFHESFIQGCGEVELDVKKVDGEDVVCYGNDYFEFSLDADKTKGVQVNVQGQKRDKPFNLTPGQIPTERAMRVNHSLLTYGDIKKITFVPLSEKTGARCPSKTVAAKASNIKACKN